MLAKRINRPSRQTDLAPTFLGLWRDEHQCPVDPLERVAHIQLPLVEMHVRPMEAKSFALAETGQQRQREQPFQSITLDCLQ